jgi:hypothetical protein
MKKIYLLLPFVLLFIGANAQNFDWAKREGLWAYDYGYGVTHDNAGNVYVAGKYEEFANFSGTVLPCQNNHDIFLAKYSSSGTMDWVRTGGGPLGDYAQSVACDGSNYVYIAGEIEGDLSTIVFPGTSDTLKCIGANDIFIAKYDLSGNLKWAKQAGWWHNEKALGVTYDNDGNVYICGFYNDTTIFTSYPSFVLGHGANNDIYVAKYDKDGVFQWVRTAGSSGRDEAKSIKCDASGNVYICGMYSDGCDFGSQVLTTPLTPTGHYYNTFVAKYTSDGTLQWVKTAGGDYDDVAWSLAIDNSNKIFISGEFNASAYFGSTQLITSGNADIFVACYDASGNIQWVKKAGGTLIDRARGIGCDGTNIYITGQFGDTANFDSQQIIAADSSDIFMAKLDNSGNFMWAVAVGGAPDNFEPLGYESGNSICADGSGYVFATGSILDGGDFGSISLNSYSRTDVFVTRLSQVGSGINEIDDQAEVKIYPNPGTGNYTIEQDVFADQKIEINIFNSLGQLVDKKIVKSLSKLNINLSAQTQGIYFVEIKSENKKVVRKKIILL